MFSRTVVRVPASSTSSLTPQYAPAQEWNTSMLVISTHSNQVPGDRQVRVVPASRDGGASPRENPRAWSLLVAARFSRRCFVATIRLRAISDSLRPWASLTFESMRENLRGARRKVTTGRYAVEDFAADAALRVRRHPLSAVSIAMVTGAVVGSLVGFGAGWFGRTRA